MDLTTIEIVRISVGLVILAYVGYCIINQKVWLRGPIGLFSKTYAWGAKEENPSVFMLHVIAGSAFGIWLVAMPFFF
ncbi:MAG: hypothetical protein CMA77_02275 [Euryarchaeota archaeon]|nr:hypothetical protein [Euryarchaeota archaeon]|tara:strand:+ start:507 stop:737 length:231 start_codon:yes stop_codon:yes gene_type:complete